MDDALTLATVIRTGLTSLLTEAHVTLLTVKESAYDTVEFRVFNKAGKFTVTITKDED